MTGVGVKIFQFPQENMDNSEKIRELIIQEMTARGFVYYDWNVKLKDELFNY